MEGIIIETKKKRQVIDITDAVNKKIQKSQYRVCLISLVHTTAAVTTADLDPGTDLDLLDAIEVIIPKLNYRHPHDPDHMPDHIASSIIGTSITLPVEKGKLVLGTWQRVVLIEFNGPRRREVIVRCW